MTARPFNLRPDRSCGACTLCCNVLSIASIEKARLTWCTHCEIGQGCKIYERRPRECADFYCAYRYSPDLGDEWRPLDCHMVVFFDAAQNRINVLTDDEHHSIWRTPRYYSQIKAWSADILKRRGHLIVWEGANAVAVLPNREVRLGDVSHRVIVVTGRTTSNGEEYEALALAPDDPRLEQFKPRA